MRRAFLLPAAWALVACAHQASSVTPATPAGAATVTGTVTYLQRIALPPTAVVKVQLADVSLADAPAKVLGEQRIEAEGRQVPFPFSITYDPAAIVPNHSYGVQARIEDAGRLLFISDRHYPVITRDAPSTVELVLKPVAGPTPR